MLMPALLCIFIWPALETSHLISPLSSLLLHFSQSPPFPSPSSCLFSFLCLSLLLLFLLHATMYQSFCVCVCVCVSSLSLQADLLHCGEDKGAGNGGQNSSLVANEFLIRATNGALPPVWLERSQSTRDRRPVTYAARVSWLLRQTWVIIPLC